MQVLLLIASALNVPTSFPPSNSNSVDGLKCIAEVAEMMNVSLQFQYSLALARLPATLATSNVVDCSTYCLKYVVLCQIYYHLRRDIVDDGNTRYPNTELDFVLGTKVCIILCPFLFFLSIS